jgi:transcriptional regulator with XRE-family HTH domain
MAILNPKALVEARKRKRWTQSQLSEATKPQINVSTISRIERGKPYRVRESTLKQFAAALEVPPKDLCEGATSEPDLVKVPMGVGARNALTLVAKRYGVSRRTIIELAPLLFYIAAEQSLIGRRNRLKEIREAAHSLDHLRSRVRHLPYNLAAYGDEALDVEAASIEHRDLFGRKIATEVNEFSGSRDEVYNDDEENPFAAFLTDALEATRGPNDAHEPVRCPWWSGEPSYEICFDEAAEIVGGDEDVARAIINGQVALREMPKGTPAERAEWARRKSPSIVLGDGEGDPPDF